MMTRRKDDKSKQQVEEKLGIAWKTLLFVCVAFALWLAAIISVMWQTANTHDTVSDTTPIVIVKDKEAD